MDIKEKIGVRVRAIRLEKEITQDALSKLTGIDRTFISHVETGSRNVSMETLEKMVKGLDVEFADFFKHEIFKQ